MNKMKWSERHVSGRYILPHMLVGEAFNGDGDILENHVQIVMEISTFDAHEIVWQLMSAMNAIPGSSHHQLVMYLKTTLEDDKRGAPDELFMVNSISITFPDKLLWTREELMSDFPKGDPPAFGLVRYVFFHGEWVTGVVNFKQEFGWEDYE